jgi:DNA-binding transcriptional MocR family regulator
VIRRPDRPSAWPVSGQVLITSGAQHAIALLARVLVAPGHRVLLEHPSYPHAIKTFSDARARLGPVALTDNGWDIDRLWEESTSAQLAYLIPDFHNPTGLCMPAATRRRLRLRCTQIIDETMADLALDGPPPTPFAAYNAAAITVGSLSKSVWGGLRAGWIRAEPGLLARLAQARPGIDLGTPIVEQLAAAWLLDTHA